MAEVSFNREISWGIVKLIMTDRGLGKALSNGDKRVIKEVMARLQYFAPQIESSMKVTAPWTDQTGNARNGLAARAYQQGKEMGIVLYHQVPYGIYLEVRWSGRYAVIGPSITQWGPKVMSGLGGIMERTNFS